MAVMVCSFLLIMLSSSTVTCGNVFIVFTDAMSIMMSVINLSNKYCWWYNFAKLLSLQQYKHMSMLREVLIQQHCGLLQWRCFRTSCCVWRNNGTVERVLTYATEPHNRYTAVMSKAETVVGNLTQKTPISRGLRMNSPFFGTFMISLRIYIYIYRHNMFSITSVKTMNKLLLKF